MKSVRLLFLFVLVSLAGAGPALAGNWYLGGGIESVSVGNDVGDVVDSGGGLALNFGYNFQPNLALDVLWGVSTHDDVDGDGLDYGRFALGLNFIFNPGSTMAPYLTVGLSSHLMEWDAFPIEFSGGGLYLGGGLDYFFNPYNSLDVGLRFHPWEADVKGGGYFYGTADATTTVLSILYNFHFLQ